MRGGWRQVSAASLPAPGLLGLARGVDRSAGWPVGEVSRGPRGREGLRYRSVDSGLAEGTASLELQDLTFSGDRSVW